MSHSNGSLVCQGRAWIFPEGNINTDLIMPHEVQDKPLGEQPKFVFSTYRPGWARNVGEGDILIAGRNFGTGSGRPAARLFKSLGISALVVETISGLFYRNCVNYGLPTLECRGITKFAEEGDQVRVDVRMGIVENLTSGERIAGEAMPDFLCEIVEAGGILQKMTQEGQA